MQTIVTPPIYSPDEHALVRLLSAEATKQATAIQSRLKTIFGDAIWLQEPPSLHVTVMEIICNTQYTGLSRAQHFKHWHDAYNQIVADILAGIQPFDITFTDLFVSERAIIIKAADSSALNDIRAAILAKTSLPEETKIPPQITHSTLARFAKPLDLEQARLLAADIAVRFTEHVSELALVTDLGPPRFNGTPTHIYPLA